MQETEAPQPIFPSATSVLKTCRSGYDQQIRVFEHMAGEID